MSEIETPDIEDLVWPARTAEEMRRWQRLVGADYKIAEYVRASIGAVSDIRGSFGVSAHRVNKVWFDDRVAVLKDLWAKGLSASQIAVQLGGVTRNAVIGKAHRLGLEKRPSPINPSSPDSARS